MRGPLLVLRPPQVSGRRYLVELSRTIYVEIGFRTTALVGRCSVGFECAERARGRSLLGASCWTKVNR